MAVVNAGFAVYDGYKAYKAGKNKKQIAWAVASSFVGLGHVNPKITLEFYAHLLPNSNSDVADIFHNAIRNHPNGER